MCVSVCVYIYIDITVVLKSGIRRLVKKKDTLGIGKGCKVCIGMYRERPNEEAIL